jgi:hypothetical protein
VLDEGPALEHGQLRALGAHVHAHHVAADGPALALAATPLLEGGVVELEIVIVGVEVEFDGLVAGARPVASPSASTTAGAAAATPAPAPAAAAATTAGAVTVPLGLGRRGRRRTGVTDLGLAGGLDLGPRRGLTRGPTLDGAVRQVVGPAVLRGGGRRRRRRAGATGAGAGRAATVASAARAPAATPVGCARGASCVVRVGHAGSPFS